MDQFQVSEARMPKLSAGLFSAGVSGDRVRRLYAGSGWGQVVGNLVSEWTQILGLVWMTKILMEVGSRESSR